MDTAPSFANTWAEPFAQATGMIARPRLLTTLDAASAHPLTLVSAPAGFGKTLAVWVWLQQKGVRSAWARPAPGIADAWGFWAALGEAMEAVWPGAGARTRGLLNAPVLPSPEGVAAAVLAGLADHGAVDDAPGVLVLDDYHRVVDARSHTMLQILVERLPPWLRLVLITRYDPPLPLARLRAHGALAELRAADLRFDLDEAGLLLRQLTGYDLPVDALTTLYRRTEGWVAALQLAGLALRQHADPEGFACAFSGSHRHVAGYLMDEVFAGLPAQIQEFLLRTAILDRLSAPLCAALLEREADCERTLSELEQRNLFLVPLDDEGHWYRYHQLFAEMLRQQLGRRMPALVPALHRRAATWLEASGDLDAAFAHLGSAGNASELAAFVERHGRALIGRSRTAQLRRWLERLPHELIASRPLLGLWAAWLLMLAGRTAGAEQLLEQLPEPLGAEGVRFAAERAALRCSLARYRGDLVAALRFGGQARAIAPEDRGVLVTAAINEGLALLAAGEEEAAVARLEAAVDAAGPGGGAYGGLVALHTLARLSLRRGQPAQALAICARGEALAATWDATGLPALGALLVCAAEACAVTGVTTAVLATLDRAAPLLAGTIELNPTARAAALRARLGPAHLGLAGRVAPIDQAVAWLDALGAAASHTRAWLAAQRARLALAHGMPVTARAWAAAHGLADDPETAAVQRLVRIQAALAECSVEGGGPGSLEAELNVLVVQLSKRGWALLQIEASLLCACMHWLRGSERACHAAMRQALCLAAPGQLLGPLHDAALGLPLRPALVSARKHWAVRPADAELAALAGRLLDGLPELAAPSVSPLPTPQLLPEPLSPREYEILHLIAAGLSNQAIAERLVVALNTVKWYSSEIYAKLGVRSRTQALIRARELGLLN